MDLHAFLRTISIAAIPAIFAITLHEVAHGWVARHFGDRTAEMQGRLSLNPIRHIDPIGTVLLPAVLLLLQTNFLFGWAKPVPVDSRNMRNPRSSMVWVTAAGPAANIAMALVWAASMWLAQNVDLGTASAWLWEMARIGIVFNVMLAVFNMVPIPPLDGGQVLANLLPPGRASAFVESIAPFGFLILIALLATGILWNFIGPPIGALVRLIAEVFNLRLG